MIAAAFVFDNATAVLIDNVTDVSEADELLFNLTRDRVTHCAHITYSCFSNVISLICSLPLSGKTRYFVHARFAVVGRRGESTSGVRG